MFYFNKQTIMKKYVAEMIGTMVLVLMGCGAAVFAGAGQPFDSVGTLGVAFAYAIVWRNITVEPKVTTA